MYATFNIEKITTNAMLNARDRHNRRLYDPENAKPELYHLNQYSKDENGEEINAYKKGRLLFEDTQIEREQAGARKMRKTAIKAVELVLGASGEFFDLKGREPQDVQAWVDANIKWAEEYYKGRGVVLNHTVHFCETNPHIHIMFAPITRKKDKTTGVELPVYSAKEFVGNRVEMRRARTSHAKAMAQFGLERGKQYTKEGYSTQNDDSLPIRDLRKQTALEAEKLEQMEIEKAQLGYHIREAEEEMADVLERLNEAEEQLKEDKENIELAKQMKDKPVEVLFKLATQFQMKHMIPYKVTVQDKDSEKGYVEETRYSQIKPAQWVDFVKQVPAALLPYLNCVAYSELASSDVAKDFKYQQPTELVKNTSYSR